MEAEPLLVAILFTYNHQDSIGKCIESLLHQETKYGYEIHIWDDCSIDQTSTICRHFASQYPEKIKLVVQKENTFLKPDLQLQSFAAIKNIRSKYFCVIDGDDYWCDPNKIEVALDFLESNHAYMGFAHDTEQVNRFDGTRVSYIHDHLKIQITNPVTLDSYAPFFLTSSRIFRNCGYNRLEILPIDYLVYYYHLSRGPIYYHDKIMAGYVIGENCTFANLEEIKHLCAMFPYRLSLMFNFKHDEFCSGLLKKYDTEHGLGERRYHLLVVLKFFLGKKRGWTLWMILVFVWRYGFECMGVNYVYDRRKAKLRADIRCNLGQDETQRHVSTIEYIMRFIYTPIRILKFQARAIKDPAKVRSLILLSRQDPYKAFKIAINALKKSVRAGIVSEKVPKEKA